MMIGMGTKIMKIVRIMTIMTMKMRRTNVKIKLHTVQNYQLEVIVPLTSQLWSIIAQKAVNSAEPEATKKLCVLGILIVFVF